MPYKNPEDDHVATFTFEGKRYYCHAKTDREAQRKAAKRLAELEAGKVISRNMSVDDWCEEWLTVYKRDMVNGKDLKDKKSIIRNFIVPIGSERASLHGRKVSAVLPLECQKILSGMVEEGYSQTYIKKTRDILHGLFTQAEENGLCLKNPAANLKCPKGKANNKRRQITEEERTYTLKVCDYNRGGLFILLMLFCGLRPQEVAALDWSNINLDDRTIYICKALKSDGSFGDPKSAAGFRTVPIPAYLYDKLVAVKEKKGLVCTNSKGGVYTRTSIKRMWTHFKHDLNIEAGCETFRGAIVQPEWVAEDFTLYCFRHTYCCDLRDAGVPIETARELMGHDNISVTAEIYQHQTPLSISSTRTKLDAYLGGKVTPYVAPNTSTP